MFIFIFADNKGSHYYYFLLTSVYGNHGNYLPYFVKERVCITVNLLIDQNIILYLLLHEIIFLDDENFLECVLVMSLICWRFHFQ